MKQKKVANSPISWRVKKYHKNPLIPRRKEGSESGLAGSLLLRKFGMTLKDGS